MDNSVTLIGRIGADPRKYVNPGKDGPEWAVCTFSLCTSKRWLQKDTKEPQTQIEWHLIECRGPFGQKNTFADHVSKSFQKGDLVVVHGELHYRERNNTKQDGMDATRSRPIKEAYILVSGSPRSRTGLVRLARKNPGTYDREGMVKNYDRDENDVSSNYNHDDHKDILGGYDNDDDLNRLHMHDGDNDSHSDEE